LYIKVVRGGYGIFENRVTKKRAKIKISQSIAKGRDEIVTSIPWSRALPS